MIEEHKWDRVIGFDATAGQAERSTRMAQAVESLWRESEQTSLTHRIMWRTEPPSPSGLTVMRAKRYSLATFDRITARQRSKPRDG